jgi:ATP-binding cassette subfamily B multidrug efflux pump
MSEQPATKDQKVLSAPNRPPPRTFGGGPFGGGGMTEKPMNFGPSVRRLLGRLRPEQARLVGVLVLGVISVALMVIGPRIIGRATDIIFAGAIGRQLPPHVTLAQVVAAQRAAGHGNIADMLARMHVIPGQGIDFGTLGTVLLVVLGLYVTSSIFSWLQGYLLNDVVQRTVYQLRADVEGKLHRLPLSFFDQQPRGEILSRVTNDIDNLAQSLQQTISQLLFSALTVVGVLLMMFLVSPPLALIALVTVPVSVVVATQVAKRSQKQFVAQWKNTGALNAHIEEAFTGHDLVTVFGRRREVEEVFRERNQRLFEASFGAQFISGLIMPAMMFIGNLNYVAIAVIGGLRVANGSITLGDVQAFIQYSRQFTQPLTQVASMANLLQSGVASAERVFELLDTPEESADPVEAQVPAEWHGRVEFEHISFRYQLEKPLIEDVSLVAQPGHTIAIVGPTGAGKTTLVNLIMRFYELDAGRITLDGVDIATMRREDLRSHIGMVLQDTWLFGGTIRDNIAYGKPGATEEEIHAAAEATFVDRFVHSLPKGYETIIEEEGNSLSAGEMQLLTIARAFLTDPSLLILDEATSSVDTRTELLLQRAMAALRTDRTSFVIAHRLSTIRHADLILVMEGGRIVEQGNHEQLLAARGAYYRLYSAQFRGGLEEEGAAPPPAAATAAAGVHP